MNVNIRLHDGQGTSFTEDALKKLQTEVEGKPVLSHPGGGPSAIIGRVEKAEFDNEGNLVASIALFKATELRPAFKGKKSDGGYELDELLSVNF